MWGHPERSHGCPVRRAPGQGYPGHWAECSVALLLLTLFVLSMPVPGQPSPLDLRRKHVKMLLFMYMALMKMPFKNELCTCLDRVDAEMTASIAAGSEATAARAVLPGPTSRSP